VYSLSRWIRIYLVGATVPDTSPPQGDARGFAICGLFASGFAVQGTARLLNRDYITAGVAYVVAIVLFVVGLKWGSIRQRIGTRARSFFERVGNDSRYWISATLLSAFILAITGLVYVHGIRSDLDIYVIPRTITDRQAADLREFLSQRESHDVTLRASQIDGEALEYWAQLSNAIRSANWNVKIETTDTRSDDPKLPAEIPTGLCIWGERVNNNPSDPKRDPTEILLDAFVAAHIPLTCSNAVAASNDKLWVLVGRRPYAIRPEPTPWLLALKRWFDSSFLPGER
jgi:hypothetical protein